MGGANGKRELWRPVQGTRGAGGVYGHQGIPPVNCSFGGFLCCEHFLKNFEDYSGFVG